jgi:hypothetical protein
MVKFLTVTVTVTVTITVTVTVTVRVNLFDCLKSKRPHGLLLDILSQRYNIPRECVHTCAYMDKLCSHTP